MPKYEQFISPGNIDKESVLAICYQAMSDLNWTILFAGEDSLVGSTSKKWKTKGQQIICTAEGSHLIIRSEMIRNELADITGRNKKNVTTLIKAFETAKDTIDTTTIETNIHALKNIKEATIRTAEEQQQQAAELDKAMNLSGSNLYVTYAIIALNVLVFILMAVNGAGIFEPNGIVHIQWGSNFTPLTLSGDWWRLFTNIFIHFGIIHLGMNMYCLYMVGIYLEPMLGKARYTIAYLCTGVLASITSLWWHHDAVNSAGASGAIFGIYGLFLALLTTSLIPKLARQSLLQSIGIFVAYNLIYGMKSGVDNAAHVGGLVSGFIIGYGYVYAIKKEKEEQPVQWMLPATVLITAAVMFFYLQKNKLSQTERAATLSEVKAASYKDNEKFNKKLNEFDEIHKTINDFIYDTTLTDESLNKKIAEIGFPQLQTAKQSISATKNYDISPAAHIKADKLLQFLDLKKNELELLKQMTETKNYNELIPQLNDTRVKENTIFEELIKK